MILIGRGLDLDRREEETREPEGEVKAGRPRGWRAEAEFEGEGLEGTEGRLPYCGTLCGFQGAEGKEPEQSLEPEVWTIQGRGASGA